MFRVAVLLLGSVVAFNAAAEGNATFGESAYRVCAGCHGFEGEGNRGVFAPSLAGQESWYIQRQLENFVAGIRGGESDDAHGQSMALMSKALRSTAAIENVTAYVASLPAANSAKTLDGDIDAGKQLYATCSACHGVAAEGNPALNAPALAGLSDWYQLLQLGKFKSGQRGAHPGDTYGQQMVPIMATLTDEAAMLNVVSYISSLK